MHIPQQFKLFSQTWRTRTAEPGELPEDLGQCRPDQLEVVINHNQSPESLIHTFVHEVVHCIELKQQLELTERQVDLIALGLIDLMRSNPQFYEVFTEDA